MVRKVVFGKVWEIATKEEYDEAMAILDSNEFCARMSDSFREEERECNEINRQRAQVTAQAKEKGII